MIVDEKYRFDNGGRKMTIARIHDVEPLIDEITDIKNNTNKGWSKSRVWRRAGSIPMVVVHEQLMQGRNILDGSEDSAKWVKKWLRENSKFRVGNV